MTEQKNPTPRWATHRGPVNLGVIIIAKDEVENLPALFESIAPVADEVVVVDTGSTDGTLALCKRWKVTVLQDRWQNDFSRARNRSIQAATAKYLLWLDADDRLPDASQAALCTLRDGDLAKSTVTGYELKVQNTSEAGTSGSEFTQIRIFPRRAGVRFRNAVHEEIGSSLAKAGIPVKRSGIAVTHTGYSDRETVVAKTRRNIVLLEQALANDSTHAHYLVHLAQARAELGEVIEADKVMTEAIARLAGQARRSTLLAEIHVLRARYRHTAGNVLAAMYDLRQAIEIWPDWALPDAMLADYQVQNEDWDDAEESISRARSKRFHVGVISFPLKQAESNLGFLAGYIKIRQGDDEGAIAPLTQALTEDTANLDARMALGQILLERGDFREAREVLEPAGSDEKAVDRFVEVSAAIGLARAMTGDEAGAQACLAPLVNIFSNELAGAAEVGPMELAEVFLKAGYGSAAKNMVILLQHTAAAA